MRRASGWIHGSGEQSLALVRALTAVALAILVPMLREARE